MDGHQESLAVAYVARAHDVHGMDLGTMGTRQADLAQLLRPRHSKTKHLVVVSAAGPCGSWLDRYRSQTGDVCWVVAPSLIPQQAGDHVTTARREAGPWARFMRAGDLPPVSVPTVADDAIRALGRAREEAIADVTAAKCRLQAFWLRHDIHYTGQATWGPPHRRWLSEVVGPTPAPHMVFQAYVRAVTDHTERRQRLAQALHAHVQSWCVHPVVKALQAWRGEHCTVAVTTVAALGDVTRVEHPRQRMQSLGLRPSAYATGERRWQGTMTKAGHTPARRALVTGAWASRDPANVRRHRPRLFETPPKGIQDISWNAPGRLYQHDRRLSARGKHATPVVVAIARERVGCRWAMATQVPVTPYPMDEPCTHPGAGCQQAGEETPRRGGVTLDGVTRPAGILVPRARPAPDGRK